MANQYLSEELGTHGDGTHGVGTRSAGSHGAGAPGAGANSADELAVGAIATVSGPEARHAVTVSRLAVGEDVRVGDGAGTIAVGIVTAAAATEFSFEVRSIESASRPAPAIWLAQALAKGDRDELAIQAATELGVDGIIPWAAARSISRWEGSKVAKGEERWRAVVREATKQSARAWLPEVAPLVTTKQLAALAEDLQMIVLDPLADEFLTGLALDEHDIVLIVGPEGGISPAEIALLREAGAVGARLGTGILRTSTAGPAAIAVLSAKLGRW
jgi:16S rRNA (uracil1498-N3)-methyltransferase